MRSWEGTWRFRPRLNKKVRERKEGTSLRGSFHWGRKRDQLLRRRGADQWQGQPTKPQKGCSKGVVLAGIIRCRREKKVKEVDNSNPGGTEGLQEAGSKKKEGKQPPGKWHQGGNYSFNKKEK